MGGGDVKLAAALALWFAPGDTLLLLVLMSLAGGVLTVIVMIEHQNQEKPRTSGGSVRRRHRVRRLCGYSPNAFLTILPDVSPSSTGPFRGGLIRHGREESCAAHRSAGHCGGYRGHGQEHVYGAGRRSGRGGARGAAWARRSWWRARRFRSARSSMPKASPIRPGRRNSSRAPITPRVRPRAMSPR